MSRLHRWFFLVALLAATLAVAPASRAAEERGADKNEGITEVFKWINFAVVAGGIVYLCAKKGPGFFRKRAELIGGAIASSTAAKAEAIRQLQESEKRVAGVPGEIAALRRASAAEAAAETERIRAATQNEAAKIAAAAKAEIEAAERAARIELKVLAAKLSVEGAEALLAKELTAISQAALLTAFVESLSGRPN